MHDNNLIIRDAVDKDFVSIKNVVMKASSNRFLKEQLSEDDINEIEERYSSKNLKVKFEGNFYYVAEIPSQHKIVGVIGLKKNDGSEIHDRLSMFYIDPDYQKRGIGRLLYEKIKCKAFENGCKKMVVSSSPYAEPIYEHFGFKRINLEWKEHKNGSKSYNIWMEKIM